MFSGVVANYCCCAFDPAPWKKGPGTLQGLSKEGVAHLLWGGKVLLSRRVFFFFRRDSSVFDPRGLQRPVPSRHWKSHTSHTKNMGFQKGERSTKLGASNRRSQRFQGLDSVQKFICPQFQWQYMCFFTWTQFTPPVLVCKRFALVFLNWVCGSQWVLLRIGIATNVTQIAASWNKCQKRTEVAIWIVVFSSFFLVILVYELRGFSA